jgi:hypothetical protein
LRINTSSGACLTLSNCHHVTISNCILGPSPSGLGIDLENCSDILITNCAFINSIGGVYANNSSTIKVNNNQFSNIAVNHGSRGQFVQFNQVTGAGNEIKDNVGENVYGIGDPGDLINIYNSSGTSTSPIVVSGNKLRNGSNNNTTGGILVGDQGGSYITVQNNTLVNSGHFGVGVAGGNYIKVLNNNIYIRPLDIPGYYANVSGVYVWGQGPGPCSNIDLEGNAVDYDHTPGYGRAYDNDHQFTCEPPAVILANNNWEASLGTGILPDRMLCPLLMGYYKFNANWNDNSGNALTATSYNTAFAGQGQNAMCANFDGVQSSLTLAHSPWLEPTSQRITASCWIKPLKVQGIQGIAQSQNADGYNSGWRMILLDNVFNARVVTSNGAVDIYCTGITLGNWVHLVMTYDGKYLRGYVNGVLQASAAITGNILYNGSNGPVVLGNSAGTGNFYGYMDEFKFYDGNLLDSEILQDYNLSYPLVNNPPPEIRAYYSFNGSWMDNSGNGLTATSYGTSFVCNGANSYSANFNGTSSYITIPSSPLLDPFSSNLTVSCWVRPTSLNGIHGLVQSQNGDGYSDGWRMSLSNGAFNPRVVTNQGPVELYCPGLTVGVWNYVAMTYDGLSLKGYVNGVLQGSASWGGYIPYNSNLLMRAGYCNGSTYYFGGYMDEFKFYDGALSATSIQQEYNNAYPLINAIPNCTLPMSAPSKPLLTQPISISQEEMATAYIITPNPASEEIRISAARSNPMPGQHDLSILRVELYSSVGQLIKALSGSATELKLTVSDLSEGIYFLRIASPVDVTTKKILIKRL